MNLPKRGGSFTRSDLIQNRNETQIQAFCDLIVHAFRRRQLDQLSSQQLAFAGLVRQELELFKRQAPGNCGGGHWRRHLLLILG
jgi:hypothetical protein